MHIKLLFYFGYTIWRNRKEIIFSEQPLQFPCTDAAASLVQRAGQGRHAGVSRPVPRRSALCGGQGRPRSARWFGLVWASLSPFAVVTRAESARLRAGGGGQRDNVRGKVQTYATC